MMGMETDSGWERQRLEGNVRRLVCTRRNMQRTACVTGKFYRPESIESEGICAIVDSSFPAAILREQFDRADPASDMREPYSFAAEQVHLEFRIETVGNYVDGSPGYLNAASEDVVRILLYTQQHG